MNTIDVWREFQNNIQHVGIIGPFDGEIRFSYDSNYRGEAISVSLPLSQSPHSARATSCFFSGLIPEGSALETFSRMFHAGKEEFIPYLQHLNNESLGALLFSINGDVPYITPSYKPIETNFLNEFALKPFETAVQTMNKTRLSLTGAMAKIGLYLDEEKNEWFYPFGGAPSTHIIKAANSKQFPLETINEALCLGIARRCDFPAAECSLISVKEGDPLLAVRRFDRIISESSKEVDGMPAPIRIHQEDFSQATSNPLKYEPTDGFYLPLISSTTRQYCQNAFGESSLLIEYVLFDYLIGNCDNHLKNFALLYNQDWNDREIAPLYDVISTVAYPNIYLEMGVSFGGDRRIDHVSRSLFQETMRKCAIPSKLALRNLQNLAEAIPSAIREEAEAITEAGFPQVSKLVGPLLKGVITRAEAILG